MDGVGQNPLDVRIVVGGAGLMPGLEIKDLPISSCKCASASENRSTFKPSEKNHIIRFWDGKRLTIEFFIRKINDLWNSFRDWV